MCRAFVLVSVVFSLVCAGTIAMAQPKNEKQELRDQVLKAGTANKAGKAYQDYFQHVGMAGVRDLVTDKDTGIALQASWEVHKKAGNRPKHIAGRTDHLYDSDELGKFLVFLKDRTKAPVPKWWAEAIVEVDVFPKGHHAFVSSTTNPVPKLRESKAEFLVPEGTELTQDGDKVTFTVGGRSVGFTKTAFGEDWKFADCVVGLVGEKRSVIAPYTDASGFPFVLAGFDGKGGKPDWKVAVWAAGRTFLGGRGHHWVELTEKDGVVFIFGAESHGMYLEAFEIATGKCQFRFCTCYWFRFSEEWDLK